MSQTIGELTLKVLLETAKAESNAGKFGNTLKSIEVDAKASSQATKTLADKMVTLGLAMGGIREISSRVSDTIRTMFSVFRQVNQSYQSFLSSTRQLEATSRLTGANLDVLRSTSGNLQSQFSLNANQANSLTIELTKLGQKAGDVSKVQESVSALLDLGAGQGLNLEQTLVAVKQAVLGIDEGTDKLFQKNPIVLYEEYGQKIGKTVGKMTDQEKSQALLNALLESGGKLTGQYSEYLNTAAGKQQLLNTRLEQAKITLGQQLNPAMLKLLDIANGLVRSFSQTDSSSQELVIRLGLIGIAVAKLAPLIISLDKTFNTFGSNVNNLSRSVPQSFDKIGNSAIGVFGKGGLVVTAILATLSIIDSIFDKIEQRKKEHDELMSKPTPAPNVPPGYKSQDGMLVPDSSSSIINFDTYKKAKQQQGTEDPTSTNSQRKDLEQKEVGKSSSGDKPEMISTELDELAEQITRKRKEQLRYEELGLQSAVAYLNVIRDITELEASRKRLLVTVEDLRSKSSLPLSGLESLANKLSYAEGNVSRSPIETIDPVVTDEERMKAVAKERQNAISEGVQIYNSVTSIMNVLGLESNKFVNDLINGFNTVLTIMQAIKTVNSILGFIPGFAVGGSVPGAGSGDTVPAMLTPGEFVVRKSVVQKLGTGFFEWINGGGLLSSMVNKYATGGLVTASSQAPAQVYLINSKVRGNDIELALKRTGKINSRRLT